MTELTFDLPMPPSVNKIFANVPGVGRVKTEAYKNWITEAGWMLLAQRNIGTRRHRLLVGPVEVSVTAYRPANKKRDLDNILKALLDLLTSTQTIKDDSQVVALSARWVEEGPPCTMKVKPI